MDVARRRWPLASITLALTLSACRDPAPPPAPRPVTRIAVPTGDQPAPTAVSTDASVRSTDPPATPDPWADAYVSAELPPNVVLELSSRMTSAATPYLRDGAAFMLGRRTPDHTIGEVLSVLPADAQRSFIRGMAGRPPPQTLRHLPAGFARELDAPDTAPALAAVAERLVLPIDALDAGVTPRLLTSDTVNDQIAGARLLALSGTTLPPVEMLYGLRPQAIPALVKSLGPRTAVPVELWVGLIETVRARVVSNPRAWGNAWVALRDGAPVTLPPVQQALRTAIPTVDAIAGLPLAVTAALHCGNARVLDGIDHVLTRSLRCATGTEHWRALATAVEVLAVPGTPPATVTASIHQILHDASNDVRVLEATPPTAVTLPPSAARPILETLAASLDPGVLAALLEQLALHVQHARGLSAPVRTALLAAPFALPEAQSIEARTHALSLARALRVALPQTAPVSRALQSAMSPDAGVHPEVVGIPSLAVRGTLTLTTTHGRVVIALREDTAREATDAVVQAAAGGRYNGTVFHRVVPGFVVQGGDPRQDGYGGTDTIIPTELSGERFDRGAVGIALAGLDSGGMQFFIVTADAPHLDGRYPAIGRVVDGMDVVDGLMVGDSIERAEFVPRVGQ